MAGVPTITPVNPLLGTCIPDNSTNVCYTITKNGSTITSINVIGDLSTISSTDNGTTITYCVISKDDIGPGCSPAKRGKGRIIVNYNDGGCGGTIYFDIFKSFNTNLPPIVGPKCVAIGDIVTYSVCKILSTDPNYQIGQDNYTWTIPAGFTETYFSSDNSSKTFTVTAIPTTPLQVQFGQCNPTAISTLNIQKRIPSPQTLLAPATPICVAANAPNINFSVNTTNNPAGCTYAWTTDNPNWTITNPTSTTPTINFNSDGGTGNVILTVTNGVTGVGCGPVTTTFKVNRNLTGLSFLNTCITKPGSATLSLTGASGISTIPVNWSFAPVTGWSNTPLNGSTTIVSASASAVNTVVTASSVACPTPTIQRNLVITPTLPNNPTGITCLTPNSTANLTYTITGATNATGYTWTFPAGWIVQSGGTTATVVVKPNGTTAGNITVVANNVFTSAAGTTTCSSTPRTLTTAFIPGAPTGVTASCFNVGNDLAITPVNVVTVGANQFQLSVNSPVSGVTYTWSAVTQSPVTTPAGVATLASTTNTGGAIANIATFNFNGRPGNYSVSVTASNATCTGSTPFVYNFTVNPPFALNLNPSGGGGSPTQTLNVTLPTGSISSIIWFKTTAPGTQITNGTFSFPTGSNTSYNLTLGYTPGASGNYCARVTYPNGCVNTVCQGTTDYQNLRIANPNPVNSPTPNPFTKIEIMPNPAKSEFSIILPEDNTQVLVFDMKGTQVFSKTFNTGKQSINSTDWTPGEYIVVFAKDGNTETRKIVITK
jgi:hypothetical protein